MKVIYTLLIILIPFVGFGQYTYIPDNNFEQALINLGYDDVLDQYVVTSNINMVTELDVSGLGIEDLTGIEDFSDLQTLNCSFNSLDSINLSNNNNLNYLNAEQNPELFYLNIMNTNISLTSLGVNPFYHLELDNSLSNLTCISVDQDFLDSYDQIIEWPSTLCDATNTPGYWGIGADCVPFVSVESCNLGIPGCTDPDACNYDYPAFFDIIEDGSCEYGNDDPACWPGDCQDGVIINIPGCTDPEACNYKPCANEDDGSCTYTDGVCETCEYPSGYYSGGVIIDNDEDNDGICNDDEITGCTDVSACNYNPLAEFNDGSCTYIDGICETCEDGFVVDNDQDNDGVCDVDEVVGCQDIAACNYDELATDVGTCYYPSFSEVSISECGDSYDWNNEIYTSSGIYTFTTVNSVGCDSIAYLDLNIYPNPVAQNIVGEINVEPFSTHIYAVELNDNIYTWNVTGGNIITNNINSVEIIWDNVGLGEIIVSEVNYAYCSTAHILDVNIFQPIYGCTDESACNFNPNASVDDGSCYDLIASISQSGDSLIANILPSNTFHNVNWYNVQEVDGINKYWLMAENSSNFMPTFDCSYFIIANDENCSDTSFVYYFAEEARSIGQLSTSPNPTNGKVKVNFDNINNQFVRLYLMNNSGNILDEFLAKNNELEIDLSSYPSGAYHITFNSPKSKGCLNEDTFQKVSNTIILNK